MPAGRTGASGETVARAGVIGGAASGVEAGGSPVASSSVDGVFAAVSVSASRAASADPGATLKISAACFAADGCSASAVDASLLAADV
ncbi:hypothetical protein [Cryptosporangium aurantiacum]|uniref:hypothetical protein n=1 Tax=Cryptosporangium aurantiacum TaxID=134849 RepID=UPI000932DD57|nr:hypothetical protein [Cryptosporangium aurantiacum]